MHRGDGFGGAATSKPSHEVPHVQPHLSVRSSLWIDHSIYLLAGDPTLGRAVAHRKILLTLHQSRSVYNSNCGGILPGLLIPE